VRVVLVVAALVELVFADVFFDRVPFELLASAARAGAAVLSRFIRRDLRRAALFRCSTPFETARSRAEMAISASSSASPSPSANPRRNLVTFVLTEDLIDRLRWARTALRFASFLLEGMLASDRPPVGDQHEARIIARCRISNWKASIPTCHSTSRRRPRDHPGAGSAGRSMPAT